ncbi:MAG: DNA cytosine methyltransferase [Clostridia bacterium]
MKIVSFFSGAGGMDLGFELAGHDIIWANDFDQDAVNTYNKNIGKYSGHEAICKDIVKLLDTDKEHINEILPDCDIIIGGFPCQGFSIANLNRSMKDERNFLYLQLLKAISVKQPRYFLLENVKGLENMEKGKILQMILEDLENAGTKKSKIFEGNGLGYKVAYNVLNAYNFGVPENRERVIILGIRNDIVNQSNVTQYIKDDVKTSKKYKTLYIPITHSENSEKIEEIKPFQKLNNAYMSWKNKEKVDLSVSTIYKLRNMRDAIGDLPLEYDSEESKKYLNHTGSKCKVNIKNTMGNRATDWEKYAPTIMGRGSGTGGPLIPPHPEQHRRLSVREVARIQTFPDDFEFCGSNSAGYRQIGNAVPVLMAYNIGKIFT